MLVETVVLTDGLLELELLEVVDVEVPLLFAVVDAVVEVEELVLVLVVLVLVDVELLV